MRRRSSGTPAVRLSPKAGAWQGHSFNGGIVSGGWAVLEGVNFEAAARDRRSGRETQNGERSTQPLAPGRVANRISNPSFSAQLAVYLPEKEPTVFITFKDLAGISSWGFILTLALVLLGFFPIVVLVGVGAIFLATLWMASP